MTSIISKQNIINDFYYNNFDCWEIIRAYKKDMEENDVKQWENNMLNDIKNISIWKSGMDNQSYWGKQIRQLGWKCVPKEWELWYRIHFCEAYTRYKHFLAHPYFNSYFNEKNVWNYENLKLCGIWKDMKVWQMNEIEFNMFVSKERNIKKNLGDGNSYLPVSAIRFN